eukprot:CCRYP_006999-RA/>CCRYP_006999-RA protein AED:0.32 eAED:0.33 QI:0/0/0/1/0/0/2/0/867
MTKPDIYRMDGPTDFDASDSSSGEEFTGEIQSDADDELSGSNEKPYNSKPPPQAQACRPPTIATDWNDSMEIGSGTGMSTHGEDVEVDFVDHHDGGRSSYMDTTRVSFNVPQSSRYPVQNAKQQHQTPVQRREASTPPTEETPAFIRQYAREVIKRADHSHANHPKMMMTLPPPNSLVMVREKDHSNLPKMRHASHSNVDNSCHDTSFYGADASALDGTFVSIRDLNDDDDDVPSIDNEQDVYGGAKYSDARFPTETTSLLSSNRMSWQGGFFGSQVEKEDRKERRKIIRDRKGRFAGWIWNIRSVLGEVWGFEESNRVRSRGVLWETNHPIGAEMPVRSFGHTHGATRRPIVSIVLTWLLCFHIMLCGLHDLFVRYVSYRNSDEIGVSWDGEGKYNPPYWLSFEGRVLNPCIGPGSRTLTAFGAMVPGLVLSRGQWWRVGLALLESSSLLELILHCYVLNTAIGGSLFGLESKRGPFTVSLSYIVTALVGSAWSVALEKGRLVTSSGMGIAGLLAAAVVEQSCFPLTFKDDEDEVPSSADYNNLGDRHNVVTSTSNEQFSFQPSHQKKERNFTFIRANPILLLAAEILFSWSAPYSSLSGMIASAAMGVSLALLLFVEKSSSKLVKFDNKDLILSETPPPPPTTSSPRMWRDDDDSADSSLSSGRHAFNTPLMRKSILADDEDEDEHAAAKSLLRRRKSGAPDAATKTPGVKGRVISINPSKSTHSVTSVLLRVIGAIMALLLTIIPASLIAAGEDPSYEVTRASVLGCKPMRIVYKQDDKSDIFQCAGGCVPLSRTHFARSKENMGDGRCDSIGFRCFAGAGTMILNKYGLEVGLYDVPSSDGSCSSIDNDITESESSFNDEAGH